ncbi:hypothetical protein H4R34_002838 [Dimargaris verticillata]|uniref:Kinase-like domain-containing protein n=1 Tax=Dimargaris verticillata TaxID=2761393 RepID=A0A9W8B5S6_9FUNG|nr:hypothetical protein H4R34_002838 [Dimargaris verticillata]
MALAQGHSMDYQQSKESILATRKTIELTTPFSLLSFEWDYVQLSVTEYAPANQQQPQNINDILFQIDVYDATQGFSFTRAWSEFHWLNHKLRQYQSVNKLTLPILSESGRNQLSKNLFFLKTNAEKVEKYVRKVLAEPFLRCTPELFEFMAGCKDAAAKNHAKAQSTAVRLDEKHTVKLYQPLPAAGKPGQVPDLVPTATMVNPVANAKGKDGALRISVTTTGLGAKTLGVTATPATLTKPDATLPHISSMATSASLENFDLMRVIGRGCMGKVFLARDKTTQQLVAIKSISKEKVFRQDEIAHIQGERDILANIADTNHPFLMKLRYSFQNEGQLFLVLDYLPGGDIATQLARHYKFTEDRCRFYAAEILLGLEQLHQMGIVYRDLKPENMLLDRQGHILLTDFGLSKQLPVERMDAQGLPQYRRRTKTFCGTAEYLAPEMLRGDYYDQGIDFWSLGTCLYEMLTGMTPFWAENHTKMYQRVLFDRLQFPPTVSWEARSLIAGLLAKDPHKRLGANNELGIEQIKAHPFFASINWDDIIQRRAPVPYAPPVAYDGDVSNFEDVFLKMPVELGVTNRDYLNAYYKAHGYLLRTNEFNNPFERYDYVSRHLPRAHSQHPAQSGLSAAAKALASIPVSPTRSHQHPQNLFAMVNTSTVEQLQKIQRANAQHAKVYRLA